MKIDIIEKSLYKYLNEYIYDVIENYKDGEEWKDNINERFEKFVNDNDLSNMSENTYIINTLEAILSLDQIPIEEVVMRASQRFGEEIFNEVSKEIGAYDKIEPEIIYQIITFYKSRLLLMLISQFEYFDRTDYDIFLSHSSIDSREVLGLKLLFLFEHNLSTYIDWLDDFQLNYLRATQKIISLILDFTNHNTNILFRYLEEFYSGEAMLKEYTNKEITNKILDSLRSSGCVLYVDSRNSRYSKWMPFELGYAMAYENKPIYRMLIQYKRTRIGSIKNSSFLSDFEVIDDIDKFIKYLNIRSKVTV
ncbi:hypothetical protein E3U55_15745 [Filobacillus milosensis]|uniref:TIR domain-containing protein n=1 Tax=Filobacillus milosensis TaxID=94137 RepID=A0A4Y8IER8_9BACI|nr:hypothetical protein [Filobacillus milosensis]TFB13572.1 hypothetical protein E3U55_15745 [Filobacillus milosensis]